MYEPMENVPLKSCHVAVNLLILNCRLGVVAVRHYHWNKVMFIVKKMAALDSWQSNMTLPPYDFTVRGMTEQGG